MTSKNMHKICRNILHTLNYIGCEHAIGRVDIEWISNSEIIISWIEDGDDSSNILARRISLDNNLSNETLIEKIPPGRVTGYPQMEVFNENVLFAWTENKKTSAIKSKWLPISDIGK